MEKLVRLTHIRKFPTSLLDVPCTMISCVLGFCHHQILCISMHVIRRDYEGMLIMINYNVSALHYNTLYLDLYLTCNSIQHDDAVILFQSDDRVSQDLENQSCIWEILGPPKGQKSQIFQRKDLVDPQKNDLLVFHIKNKKIIYLSITFFILFVQKY